ncbi:MAG: bacterial Ig-like domain-containing protein [Acholeplasmataceae bacterium]|nr:bacterial Ig-like domain-containing protein [Acholeplasmataceae bacterium]
MKKFRVFLGIMMMLVSVLVVSACDPKDDDDPIIDPITFSISLNSATKTVVQGDSFILTVSLDGITDYDSIGWATEGDLVSITPNGLNAIVEAGTDTGVETITVTVTKDDVDETATCVVTVNTIALDLVTSTSDVVLNQGESTEVSVTIDPSKTGTVVSWTEDGTLLTVDEDGLTATLTAGAAVGTTTVTVTAEIFGESFEEVINVTVNEIVPFVDILQSSADVRVGEDLAIDLEFVTAYQEDKTWNVTSSDSDIAIAEVTAEDTLSVTGLSEGEATLTLTMTTNGIEYQDTINVFVRPLGYVSVAESVYDPFDLQLNFIESTLFSSIDQSIWQAYDILFGASSNAGQGDLRGQFVFAMNHAFAKDGDKDVIQVMANGMSAMAIRIPDGITDLAAVEFSMKVATLDPELNRSWRMDFLIATVVDGNTTLYGRALAENQGISLGSLTIPFEDLLREGYHTYQFNVDAIPENAGRYIVIYFGNTNAFNGVDGDRTYIDGFNFLSREQTGITLTTPPAKTEYVVGQAFDPNGMVVSAVHTVGNDLPIDHADLTFDYDFSTPGATTVTVTSGDYTIDVEVNVIAKVITELELTTMPDQIVYTDGDLFDETGMVVTAHYNDGTSVVVSDYALSSDPLVAGQPSVEISYDGLTLDVPITVNTALLTGIEVTQAPDKTSFVVGQSADYTGIIVTATYADLSTSVIPFDALIFSGFDASMIATDQVITVTYADQTATFTIDIIERVANGIMIQTYPRMTYLVGETEDLSGLTVVLVYNDDSTEPVDFGLLSIEGFDASTAGEVTIVITYLTFDTSFVVTITDEEGYAELMTSAVTFDTTNLVANSTMYTDFFIGETPANKADYDVLLGRVLNDAERNLQYSTAIYMSGEGEDAVITVQTNGMSALAVRIPDGLTAADITAFSFSLNAAHTSTVVADTVTFRPSFRFSSIADGVEYFHAMDRGAYYLSQSGSMTVTHADYSREGYHDYTVQMNMPELAEGVTLGNYILMYMGNNGSFRDSSGTSLLINGFKFWTRDVVTDIALMAPPTKTTYEVGEAFDPAGMDIAPLYGVDLYSKQTSLPYGDLTFDYDFSTVGEKVVTVSYGDSSVEIVVNVIVVTATGLEVTILPDKVNYNAGEVFDPTGMVITILYDNETSSVTTEYTYDMTPVTTETTAIEVSYEGLTVSVPITVNPASLESIAVTTPALKTDFVVGEAEDFTGIVVTATYSDTTTSEVAFEDLVFSGFDASVVASDQVITVTFGELTTTFTIDIIERAAVGIDVQTEPTLIYLVGEVEDFSGLVVVLVYNDDSTEAVDFADLNITGFDSSVVGEVTITVTYLTFDTSFVVTITDQEGYAEIWAPDMNFDTTNLVANNTMYTALFSGETPANQADFDVLLGRALNDAERNLQYSTAIYFAGEGEETVITVQTNGMTALAVRIPDGLSAADITAFSFSMNAEHTSTLVADTVTFRPSFRFSSIADGVEYFHATDRGAYYLAQSGGLTIAHADYSRAGYHDYTVEMTMPALAEGVTLGNYILMYMGNNGSFRDTTNTSLLINGFKFYTDDVVSDISLSSAPTQLIYEVGEAFNSEGLVITPSYAIVPYDATDSIDHGALTFDYDFSVVGETTVTIQYRSFSLEIQVTVVEPEPPLE